MAINVRNSSGGVLGSISNGKILNNNGGELGHVSGNKILNNNGGELGHVSGNKILNNNGGELAHINHGPLGLENGNIILNNSGGELFRVDDGASDVEIGAAAIFLYNLGEEQKKFEPPPVNGTGGGGDENPGCLGRIIGAIIGAVGFVIMQYLKTWPGRIGVAYGLAFGILGTITQHAGVGVGIFLSIVFILICGALGLLGGFISSKLSRQGNFGALIGAGATGIAMIVFAAIDKQALPWILMFFLLSAVPGLVAGTIIGSIVGLVKKQIDKKK
jgi:hypothetical protein